MLKKLAWGGVALGMMASVVWAAGDSAGGMSIGSLSSNIVGAITTAASSIVGAISGNAVTTVASGVSAPQALPLAPQNGSTFPTAPQSAAPNLVGSGTISALNGYVSIPTGTLPGLAVQISGTFVATLAATCSNDNDATSTIAKSFLTHGSNANTVASAATVSAPGNWGLIPGACDHIRITATSWTSGTITVTWEQTGAPFDSRVSAPIAAPLPGTEVGSQNPAAGLVPGFSTASGSATSNGVVAKSSPGVLYDATAVNTSSTLGYLVALNLAALPASGASIAPMDLRPVYPAVNGSPGFAEIDAKPGLSCTVGCVAVMSASPFIYTPTPTGAVSARAR